MNDRTDDLEPLVTELADRLEELETRLDAEPSRRRDLLRFTEQYAIPTSVAMLEANIRVLEAIGGAIRVAEGREDRDRRSSGRETALATLDRALAEVNDAVRGTPTDEDARQLLDEARSLRDEIDDRVRESGRGTRRDRIDETGGTSIPVSNEDGEHDEGEELEDESSVDVDAELDTIRREVHGDEANEAEGPEGGADENGD